MSKEKVVSRNIAIALGIITIILVIALVGAVAILHSQVNDLTDTANLAKSTTFNQTINQQAGSYNSWTFSAKYAGYVIVWVQSSTTTNAYARVIYHFLGVTFDTQKTAPVGVKDVFPVLPDSNIEVRVGNSNLVNGATMTVTITYYY